MIGIGVVGYGYFGPNLARNFARQADCNLVVICEPNEERAAQAAKMYRSTRVTPQYPELLNDSDVHAIVIATPVHTHFDLARQALLAGKDVFVEKPITRTSAEAEQLIELADRQGRILAVDHTYLFTGAVRKIKEIIDAGELGELIYIDAVRINLGIFQQDVNVIYDLAPHDLSILGYLLGQAPTAVRALGACHGGKGIESLAYLHLEYPDNVMAHCHLNWLAPVKLRRSLICGTKKMIVYDDMEVSEKVRVYDKGIVLKETARDQIYRVLVDYRTGDMVAPKLVHREALDAEAEHFLACVRNRSKPLVDGQSGLQVVRILEAATRSIQNDSARVLLRDPLRLRREAA